MKFCHLNRPPRALHRLSLLMAVGLGFFSSISHADDDVGDLLQNANPATAPAPLTSPTAPENQPHSDALGTMKAKTPAGARAAEIELNDGSKLSGPTWTTTETPFRVWVDEDKTYHDIDLDLVKRIEVHVVDEAMEKDWRWLKEGSDQKVYSGKQYPTIQLTYQFTLVNDQVIEGGVVAPVYLYDGTKNRTFALYKKYKGALDETLNDLIYIKSVTFSAPASSPSETAGKTTKLPLLPDS